jgi:hypothetical protein
MSAGYLRSTARAALLLAATTLVACAVGSHPPETEGGEPYTGRNGADRFNMSGSAGDGDSLAIPDYDRIFFEIHSEVTAMLQELEKSGGEEARSAEARSIVETAEEFYLEGKPLIAIRLLTEAELLLRQVPES